MATGKITKRAVDAFAADGTKQFLWDDELRGFGLQVTPAGAKSYVYQYRMGGRESTKRRYTIGRHGSPWTPDTARAECKRLALLVGQGKNPADEDRERRRQAVDLAFTPYISTFTDGYLKAHWKDWAEAERTLRREPSTILRDKPLPLITRADISAVLDKLQDRPAARRLSFSILRKLFVWAEGRGEINRSPIGHGFAAPKAVASRDRVLNDVELGLCWQAAGTLGYPFGPMYRLLIVTAARREEAASLDWSELDRDARQWTLPSDRAKNALSHIVPLNDLAVGLLDEIAGVDHENDEKPSWPGKGLVFTTTGKTPASGHSKGKARLDAAILKAIAKRAEPPDDEVEPIPPWRIHDLRRTVATGLQRLGIRFEVTEAVLNHVSGSKGGVAGVYQRHDWKAEKRAALDAWGRHVAALGAGRDMSNVRVLDRSAAA